MRQSVLKHKIALFYGLAFAISWPAWFAMSRIYRGGQPSLVVYAFSSLGGLGPLLSLLILDRLSQQAVSVKAILSQIRIRGANKTWFIPAIVAWPLITLVGNLGYYALGQEPALRLIKPGPDALGIGVLPVITIHFAASLITSPLFEEPGWRGFALPGLQQRFGRELGSLIVGLLWWLWHQPMNLTFGIQPTLYAALSMVALSFMIDSLFNLSDRNVFAAMLAHQSFGTVITFLYEGDQNLIQLGLLVVFVIALRLQEASRARESR